MLPTSHYDKEKADHAVNFIQCLRHTKGAFYNQPFRLLDWQETIIRDLFGIIKEGMVSSAQYTHGEFALSQLPEPCAIKTGTPQSPRGYDSTVLGFYPADDPQIAFAIMLEGGANAKHAVFPLVQAAIQ